MGFLGFGSGIEKPIPVNRNDRQKCWDSRDAYFACLDTAGVLEAGKEGKACSSQKATYEANCVKSWIEYFNKRRVIQEQQKNLIAGSTQALEAKKKSSQRVV